MKIYSVKFNSYDERSVVMHTLNSEPKTVSKIVNGKKVVITVGKNGDLLIPEFDLQKYESYGGGYEHVKIVGILDDKYFLGISIKEVEEALDNLIVENRPTKVIPNISTTNQFKLNIKDSIQKIKLKKYEVRLVSASFGSKPLGIIESETEKKAWDIAKKTYPKHKGYLNVRSAA